MAHRGRRGGSRHGGDQERGDPEHERRSDREHDGDDPAKHAAVIERRWEGSPPPTFERHALALKQWHALPGAVVWPATDVTPEPAGPPPDKEPVP